MLTQSSRGLKFRITAGIPPIWSLCAWLVSRILTSSSLNPSFSAEARMSGTVSAKLLLMRTCPSPVVIRYEARSRDPT